MLLLLLSFQSIQAGKRLIDYEANTKAVQEVIDTIASQQPTEEQHVTQLFAKVQTWNTLVNFRDRQTEQTMQIPPLAAAALLDDRALFRRILDGTAINKTNVNFSNGDGDTTLHTIIKYGPEICEDDSYVNLLLKRPGIAIDARDHLGRTPAMLAALYRKSYDLLSFVFDNCNMSLADNAGKSFEQYARENRVMRIVEYRAQFGGEEPTPQEFAQIRATISPELRRTPPEVGNLANAAHFTTLGERADTPDPRATQDYETFPQDEDEEDDEGGDGDLGIIYTPPPQFANEQ